MGTLKIGVNPGATDPNYFTDNGGPGSCATDGEIDFTAGGNRNNPNGAGQAPQEIEFTLAGAYAFDSANAITIEKVVPGQPNTPVTGWGWTLNPPSNNVLTLTDPDHDGDNYEYTLNGSGWQIDPRIVNHQ